MKFFNPYKQEPATRETTVEATEKELATASALTNMREDICPKCGGNMKPAALFNNVTVNYCAACRVSHPRTVQ